MALIVLGPKSLASVSRTLGKAVGEFRRVTTDFQRSLNVEAAEEEARQKRKEAAAQAEATRTATGQTDTGADGEKKWTVQPPASFMANNTPPPSPAGPPPDSPLGQALAKTREQAMKSDRQESSAKNDLHTEAKA